MKKDLRAQIVRLEAIEEIRALKARYADICDTGYNPGQMRPLFTDDAVWDGGERFGRYDGIGAVCGFFADVSSQIVWALHSEIVAITNMDDMAFSGGGDSSWYGPTLNPWDQSRTAGGSSSGSAAALFYDGFDACVGGDQGGSIRAPASWCDVVGLKPSHGLVPYTGIAGIDQTFDHCGPMGRAADRVAALLQAIAGKDPSDPRRYEVPAAATERRSPRRRRPRRCSRRSSGCDAASARSENSQQLSPHMKITLVAGRWLRRHYAGAL